MKVNLTVNQVLLIFVAICSALSASSATLGDIFDVKTVKMIVGFSNMLNTVIASVVVALTGQAGLVKQVAAMPGVEEIKVNTQANQVLASVALDPKQGKVAPVQGQETIVKDIAES
jgi:hypothetical protein